MGNARFGVDTGPSLSTSDELDGSWGRRAAVPTPSAPHGPPRPRRRSQGATIGDLTAATGWLSHTARAAITGLRRGRHPPSVTDVAREDGLARLRATSGRLMADDRPAPVNRVANRNCEIILAIRFCEQLRFRPGDYLSERNRS